MKNVLLFVSLIFVCQFLNAQNEESAYPRLAANSHATLMKSLTVIPNSPQAASLGKFGEYPVSLYTGAVDISVPITGITGRSLSLPVALNYSSGGIRVSTLPSWVGSGWDLKVGGVITCSPEGRQDTKSNYYSRGTDIAALVNTSYTDYFTQRQSLYLAAADPRSLSFDTQPDHYTLTLPGGGANFYFPPQDIDKVRGKQAAAVIIFKKVSDYKIEPYFSTTGIIDSFLVTDNQGTRYHYTSWEETYTTYDASSSDFPPASMTHRNAWYLTLIESFDRTETINLTYDTDANGFSVPVNQEDGDMVSVPTGSPGQVDGPTCGSDPGSSNYCSQGINYIAGGVYSVSVKNRRQLSQIAYYNAGVQHTKLVFTRTVYTGKDAYGISKLDKITVYLGSPANKTTEIRFAYFSGTPRLNLQSVEETDGTISKGKTSFTYNTLQLPIIKSNAIDFWGFYNGANSNIHLVPAYTDCSEGSYSANHGGANRKASASAVAGSLKRIVHPTGGYTEFTFEPHTVEKFGGCPSTGQNYLTVAGGLRIKQIDSYADNSKLAFSKKYTYTLAGSSASSGKLLADFKFSNYESYTRETLRNYNPCSRDNATFTCRFLKIYANPRSTVAGGEGDHVGYSRVTETYAGSTIYNFKNNYVGRLSYDPTNGEVTKIEKYKSDGTKVQEQSFQYASDVSDTRRNKTHKVPMVLANNNQDNLTVLCIKADKRSFEWLMAYESQTACTGYVKSYSTAQNTKYSLSYYDLKQYWGYTKSITTTDYLSDGSTTRAVAQTQTFKYDDLNINAPTSVSFPNSDGKVTELRFKYVTATATDISFISSSVVSSMKMKNMLATPVEVLRYQDGLAVDGTRMVYGIFGGAGPYVNSILRYETTWDASGVQKLDNAGKGWGTTATINGYSKGQITSLTKRGWVPTTYTYDRGLLTSVTNSNMTTSYTYDKINQLFRETAVDGLLTIYTYDGVQRLDKALSYSKDGNLYATSESNYYRVTDYDYVYHGSTDTKNYINTTQRFIAVTGSALTNLKTRVYYDGLGREAQSIKIGYSPGGYDVVMSTLYNAYNLPYIRFLPIESSYKDGSRLTRPTVTTATTPLGAVTNYEASPLLRPMSRTPPSWATTTLVYETNSSTVSVGATIYPVGSLYIMGEVDPTDTKWKNLTYTDKLSRVIMRRRTDGTTNLDTKYSYDKKDRVIAIIPPGETSSSSTLTFKYLYDGRDNVIRKYIPDQGWTDMAYNDRDLLVLSRDPNQAKAGQWMQYEYDALGREKKTGIISQGSSVSPLTVYSYTELLSETTYDGTRTRDKGKITLEKTKVLGSSPAVYLSRTYTYDDYGRLKSSSENNFVGGSDKVSYTYDWADNILTEAREHQRTGSKILVTRRYTYDASGRKDKTYMTVSRDGTVTEAEVLVSDVDYTFKDEVKTLNLGKHSGKSAFLQQVDYTYNQLGFLTEINGGRLGDLSTLTNFCGPTFPVQAAGTGVNGRDLFALQLFYDAPTAVASSSFSKPMKNGNISQMNWQVRGRQLQSYGFTYDFANRLKSARYGQSAAKGYWTYSGLYDTDYTYDSRGNFTSLKRRGKSASGCDASELIDQLSYTYTANTNRAAIITEQSIASATVTARGFTGTSSYTYDDNGNLKTDSKKGLTLTYNHLNLPKTIARSGKSTITNIYAADGRKLKTSGGSDTREYFEGIEYINGKLTSIYFEDGRIYFTGTTSVSGRYEYTIKDHLGNTRVAFTDLNKDGLITETTSASTNELLSEQQYYPFGMEMEGPWVKHSGVADKYRYNGKELNPDLGLYDYGARWYDPAVARWTSVDPLAETAHSISMSPYNYVANNPILNIDPDGMDWYQNNESGYYEWHDGEDDREGYSHVGGKGSLLGEFERHIDGIFEGGIYSDGFSLDITGNDKGALSPFGGGSGNFFDEFMNGTGPQVSVMLGDHPYSRSLSDTEAEEVGRAQQAITEGRTDVEGQMTNIGVGFGAWGLLSSTSLAEQFVGSYRLDVFTSRDGGSYLNIISDSKSRESFFLRMVKDNPSRNPSNRNPSLPSGQETTNTYQFYIWKNPTGR